MICNVLSDLEVTRFARNVAFQDGESVCLMNATISHVQTYQERALLISADLIGRSIRQILTSPFKKTDTGHKSLFTLS